MKRLTVLLLVLTLSLVGSPLMAAEKTPKRPALVLAAFGTSYPDALQSILNVRNRAAAAFPKYDIHLAFTSAKIRETWHGRAEDQKWRQAHPGVPADLYQVQGPLATLGRLQDQGIKTILVQSLHVFAGEEYADLKAEVQALAGIRTIKRKNRPFDDLVLGRPALGEPGEGHEYGADILEAVKAVKVDVDNARGDQAALLYMGHGNATFSTGVYAEFQAAMRQAYPDVPVYIGVVEGFPSLDLVLGEIRADKIKKVNLLPLMLVAGDHASQDMCGDEPDSWKRRLEAQGVLVKCQIRGLGQLDSWVDIYIGHIADALSDNGLETCRP